MTRSNDVAILKTATGFAVIAAFGLVGLHWVSVNGYIDAKVLQGCPLQPNQQYMPGDIGGALQRPVPR